MRYPKIREIKEAVVSLFSPAYTSSFPRKGHEPFPGYRGKPVVDEKNCVGCLTCANVCPPYAITYSDDKKKSIRTIRRDYGKCIFCGQCQDHCITGKGVILSDKIFDMATTNRNEVVEYQERELLLCQNCNAVITTKDHLFYLHRKLGTKAFASILNLNMLNEKLRLEDPEKTQVTVEDGLKRKDMFNILCPNCLRKVQLKSLGE
ncbi:MAG: 4Fe-4S dicluster domain-containing protein [Bacteroidales bacterium]